MVDRVDVGSLAPLREGSDSSPAEPDYHALGFDKPVGLRHVSLWGRITYSFVAPFIDKGWTHELVEKTALALPSKPLDSRFLANLVTQKYEDEAKAREEDSGANLIRGALLRSSWPWMLLHLSWGLCEMSLRLVQPFLLRGFLLWLEDYRSEEGAELADGWMWVSLMSLAVILMVLVHHSMFWIGYCLGVKARQQAVSAVQAKVLRLNTAVISDVTTGKVVNLVSNDVWRFDLFGFFWLFVLIGPLELIIVFILVSLELGVLPALAGVSILLAVIPVQAYLSKTISRLRLGTTDRTDDRVKLCSEAITGALAMKFLGWERYFLEAVTRVRAQEQSFSILRARIVSASMGLQFAVTPLVSFITFAVVRARGDDLDLASTFYAVTLLHLPKLYMCTFFVKGAQALAELNISLKRLDAFLKLPEPPPPASYQHPPAQPAPENRHANDNARLHSPFGDADAVPPSSESDDVNYEQLGWVAMRGADFCWQSRAWAGMADKKLVEGGGKPGEAGGKGRGGGWQPWARPAPSTARQISRVGTLPLARLNSAAAGGEAGGKPEPGVPAKPQDGAPTRMHDAIVEAAVEEEEEEAGSGTPLMALRAPQFRVRPGQLVAVVGQVGSGKSSLLAALLGELQPVPPPGWSGTFPSPGAPVVTGKVAYCQQVPWIKAGTVRENILFGQAMEEERFWAVVDACALRQDIEELPGGIEAELGERGINLSGGQKARVALARAAYAQADVQLLDDPLSAVDSRVGQTLFKHCIGPGGLMKDSTRILVTHHLTFLSQCDRILVLRRGQVVHDGTYAELQPLDLPELSAPAASLDAEEPDPPAPETAAASEELGRGLSAESAGSSSESVAGSGDACKRDGPVGIGEKGELDAAVPRMTDKNEKTAATASGQAGRLVKEEDREKGGVKMNVYMEYIRYCGVVPMLMVGVLLVIGQVAFVYSEIWLASWSQSDDQSNAKWLAVYGGLTAFIVAVSFVRSFTFFDCTFKGASRLHLKAVQVVLRAPLSFFHTNPTGRILNRFSKDQGQVDEMLPQNSFDFLQTGGGVVGALVIVAISTPHILPVFFLLLLVFLRLRLRYLTSSRDIKRFEATTRSPVYASFSSTLKGLSTIRAFQAMDQVRRRFLEELHLNGSWWVAFLCAARWVGFRMDCISMVVQVAAVVLAILLRDSVSEDVVAVSLTQVLQLGGVLQWCVRQSAEMENDMTSTERLVEYTHLPQEAPLAEDAPVHPPPKWPTSGALQYEKVTASYRAGLPPVLRDLSFSIPAGATCGIVGRTGCGKSSLILTLFRLINVDSGTITLDGMDTGKVGIDRLRQHLAIIPQDPVLFSGTLRSNLDPEELHTDQQLWEVLKMVALDDSIQGMGGLLVQMGEAGETLSAGQRQLFCLARVLLQDACLLALDEATANVDRRTDARIQDTLRQFLRSPGNAFPRSSTASRRRSGPGSERPWRRSGQFSSLQHGDQPHRLPEGGPAKGEKGWRTLLVVAHRLETIMDCDIVLVLSEGRLVEAGPPSQLQDQPGGTFAAMCAAATASGVQLRRATPGTGSPATT